MQFVIQQLNNKIGGYMSCTFVPPHTYDEQLSKYLKNPAINITSCITIIKIMRKSPVHFNFTAVVIASHTKIFKPEIFACR